MEKKSFFKSTSFKCIVTLLCVLLVCGIFLTICSGLFAVSDEERFERAISKIYGKNVRTETVEIGDFDNGKSVIEEAYRVKDDGNYLIKATGEGGYDGGTVTCWVVVNVSGNSVKGIDKVTIDSSKGQSYIGNITDKFLAGFSSYNGEDFTPTEGFIKTGATRSATAICNAVNGAIGFVNAKFGNVATDKYKDLEFSYREKIDTVNTVDELVTDADGNVTGVKFTIKTMGFNNAGEFTVEITVGLNGKISSYKVLTNGSTADYDSSMDPSVANGDWFVGKDINDIENVFKEGIDYNDIKGGLGSEGLKTGATQSSYLCIYAAAFATDNYEKCLPETEAPEGGNEENGGNDGNEGNEENEGSEDNNGGDVNE